MALRSSSGWSIPVNVMKARRACPIAKPANSGTAKPWVHISGWLAETKPAIETRRSRASKHKALPPFG